MDGARGPTRAEHMGYVRFKFELEPGCRQHASSTRLSCNTLQHYIEYISSFSIAAIHLILSSPSHHLPRLVSQCILKLTMTYPRICLIKQ